MIMMMINNTGNEPTPIWKLYENPFYNSHQQHYNPHSRKQLYHNCRRKQFIGPVMDSELNRAKAQITKLKAELEFERKARKKMENVNKKLVRELSEERKGRETLERVCEELGKKVSASEEEIGKMKREIGEERKMLRMAEVFREERVQMKLTEAKFLLEVKMLELEQNKLTQNRNQTENLDISFISKDNLNPDPREEVKYVLGKKLSCNCDRKAVFFNQRKPPPEPENPHIKRGIKGFVEFPKIIRAIGSRNRHFGTKFECQKAQLNFLLKQKSPIRSSNNLITS